MIPHSKSIYGNGPGLCDITHILQPLMVIEGEDEHILALDHHRGNVARAVDCYQLIDRFFRQFFARLYPILIFEKVTAGCVS
jgi:hypothetical protein